MTVAIRLARFGCKHKPFYRVVVADSSCRRDGKHIEFVGFYDPLSGEDGDKRMGLKYERIRYWLSVGAQPSEAVARILRRVGVLGPGNKPKASDSLPIVADPVQNNEATPNDKSLWANIGFPVSETNFA